MRRSTTAERLLLVTLPALADGRTLRAQSLAGGVPEGEPTIEVLELTLVEAIELRLQRNRQASMVAFTDAFRLLALSFVVMLPLILLMRSPGARRKPGGAAH